MAIIKKAAVSLVITLILFTAFTILSYSTLFDIIESKFYNKKVIADIEHKLDDIKINTEKYKAERIETLSEVASEQTIRNSYLINQSREDIFRRENILSALLEQNIDYLFIRVIDSDGKIHYSSNPSDRQSSDPTKIAYKVPDEDTLLQYSTIAGLAGESADLIFNISENVNVFSAPVLSNTGIRRGTLLVYLSSNDLRNYLSYRNIIERNIVIKYLGRSSIVFNILDNNSSILQELNNYWTARPIVNPYGLYTDTEGDAYSVITERWNDGFIGYVLSDNLFRLNTVYRYILLFSALSIIFILTFLIMNIKQDQVTVIAERVKRFQINFLIEYMDNKSEVEWKKWKKELEGRREEIRKELKKGIRPVKGEKEKLVNDLIDKSWDEIISLLAGHLEKKGDAAAPANIQINNIEEIIRKILSSEKDVRSTAVPAQPVQLTPVDVEDVEELDDAETLDEADEVLEEVEDAEEADEVLEEVEDAEAAEEVLEEVEDAEEVSEVLEEVEDAEEVDEVLEEVEDAEAVDEVLEEVEDAEAVDEVLEEVEDAEEADEVLEEVEDAEEAEEVLEEVEEVLEEVEEAEAVEEVDEVLEEVEEAEEAEEADEVLEEVEDTEEVEDAEAVDEVLEEAEAVEPAESVEDIDEVEDAETLDEADEVLDEVEDAEEVLDEAEALEEIEADDLEKENQEDAFKEPAAQDACNTFGDPEAASSKYLIREAAKDLADKQDPEQLENIEFAAAGDDEFLEAVDSDEELTPEETFAQRSKELEENPRFKELSSVYRDYGEDIVSATEIQNTIDEIESNVIPITDGEDEADLAKLHYYKNSVTPSQTDISSKDESKIPSLTEELEILDEASALELEEVAFEDQSDKELDEELETLEVVEPFKPLDNYKSEGSEAYGDNVMSSVGSEAELEDDDDAKIVDYIKSDIAGVYTPNYMPDSYYSEVRRQKYNELSGIAGDAKLEEVAKFNLNNLNSLAFSDKIEVLIEENLLEVLTLKEAAKIIENDSEESGSVVVEKDGIFEISDDLYANVSDAENQQKDELKEAIGEVVENEEEVNVSDLFFNDLLDLPVFTDENQSYQGPESKSAKIFKLDNDYGFDYDSFINDDDSDNSVEIMKFLFKITRDLGSSFGAVLVQDSKGFYPELSVGLFDKSYPDLLKFSTEDPIYKTFLSENKIAYFKIKATKMKEIKNKLSEADAEKMQSLMFFPIKFRNNHGYLLIAPGISDFSINSLLLKVKNLQK